ncbi:HEAT repeat domain-containing protein [Halovivax sp.]|uniref:HEAT repeat domain-containing protein n=1 Tax=Halovivax sp. TaxID=1935978 RepID=UPI0025C70576|nr:HEAT repeat domain-containing protein [Halovivax sp.]
MSDEATEEGDEDATPDPDVDEIDAELAAVSERADELASELEAADTEDDLDDVEAHLEDVSEDLEAIEIPEPPEEPDDEDEETPEDPYEEVRDRHEELENDLDDVESGVADQRGPYAEDVIDEVESAAGDVESTRWTEEGREELREVVGIALAEISEILGTSLSLADDEELVDALVETLERVGTEIDEAGLDPDTDAETIDALLETTDELQSGVDDATAWDDLEVREQLRREGFYDVLDHVKDFPPEWHALKVHEKQGNVEMVLLALDSFDSDFMEEHCIEALGRMGDEAAIDPMLQLANRRNTDAIAVLGSIGVADERVVDTLVDYVDGGDLSLRKHTLRALGEIGAPEAVEPVAEQLVDDDPSVRSHAARCLGLLGDTRTIDPLAALLDDDEDDTVRASAAWALRQIGTEDALDAVTQYADDRAYLVQAEAERAEAQLVG